jgi:hypothetical protein
VEISVIGYLLSAPTDAFLGDGLADYRSVGTVRESPKVEVDNKPGDFDYVKIYE